MGHPCGNGYLARLRPQLKHEVPRAAAVTAVARLNAPDMRVRDPGYGELSTAYGDASQEPAEHFEEGRGHEHDVDANISILATVRDLAAYEVVRDLMVARYRVIEDLKRQHRIRR
jgi:hypothetical protein